VKEHPTNVVQPLVQLVTILPPISHAMVAPTVETVPKKSMHQAKEHSSDTGNSLKHNDNPPASSRTRV
jgi:hypothetical protein